MSPTVILERETAGVAELRRKSFQIVLDGSPAGTIDRNQTVELPVEPGRHTLQVREGRYSSHAQSFDAADGTTSASAATERSSGPNTSRHSSCPRSASSSNANRGTFVWFVPGCDDRRAVLRPIGLDKGRR